MKELELEKLVIFPTDMPLDSFHRFLDTIEGIRHRVSEAEGRGTIITDEGINYFELGKYVFGHGINYLIFESKKLAEMFNKHVERYFERTKSESHQNL